MFHTNTKKLMTKGALVALSLSSLIFTTTLADDYLYVDAAHLNVRAESTFRSSIVATIDSGYKVTVLESLDNGWKKVLLENGEEGYVNGRYLTENAPYYEKADGAVYEVNVPSAYVRAEGLVKKVAVLHKGDKVEVLDEKVFLGKWLRVRVTSAQKEGYQDRVGYISKKLVTVTEESRYAAMESGPVVESSAEVTDDWIADEANLNSAPAEVTVDNSNDTAAVNGSGTTTTSDTADSSENLDSLLGDLLK